MKVCVLRRDGQDADNVMAFRVNSTVEELFGKKDIFPEKDFLEFTRMLTFEITENEKDKILPFIMKISRLDTLYAVRIKA